jgi:hypothetical protein
VLSSSDAIPRNFKTRQSAEHAMVMPGKIHAILVACLVALANAASAATVALGSKGFDIDAGAAGKFLIAWPQLVGGDAKRAPTEVKVDGQVADAKYADGTTCRIELRDAGLVQLHFKDVPGGFDSVRLEQVLSADLRGKLEWAANGGAGALIPKDYPGKPFLFQGDARRFTLSSNTGDGFAIVLPSGFQQFQDNREWKNDRNGWFSLTKLPWAATGEAYVVFAIVGPKDKAPELKAKVAPGDKPAVPAPVVTIDRFGQFINKAFDGKVRSEEELKGDVERDRADLAALVPPATDAFGGIPGTGDNYGLKKTGFFHLGTVDKSTVLVTPEGNAFFQLGVCSALTNIDDYTLIEGRHGIYEALPDPKDPVLKTAFREGYKAHLSFYIWNLIRKYDQPFNPETQAQRMIERMRKWGFNSGGAWAVTKTTDAVVQQAKLPYVQFLPINAPKLPLANIWDPFADGIEAKLDEAFAKAVAPRANDPLLIGWFITNEPAIEDVPKVLPTLKAKDFAAKRELVKVLAEKYKTIDAFNAAWETTFNAFDELGDASLAIATKAASNDLDEFFKTFLERRYSLVRSALNKHDPNHLLIGDRWTPGSANNESIVTIGGKYLDVISVNYYGYVMDKAFLDRVHAWAGNKPLLLSEFHYCARDQGLTGGAAQVASQLERGLAYRNYVEQAAATGYVVGVQWFSAVDQAPTGRFFQGFNGEAANIGLVNVADRPYRVFLAEAMKTNYDIFPVIIGKRPPFAFDDARFRPGKGGGRKVVQIPRLPKAFSLDGSSSEFPTIPPTRVGGEGLVLGDSAADFDGTFRLAWDERNLYLFAEIRDPTPMKNSAGNDYIWSADAIELFTGYEELSQGGGLKFGDRQIILRGANGQGDLAAASIVNAPKRVEIKSKVVPGFDGKSYAIEAAIPWAALGFTPQAGQEMLFDIAFDDATNGRRQIAWNGTIRNSKDRGAWGRAEFTN